MKTQNNITNEDALKDLNVIVKEDEYTEKSGLPKELASLIYAAYRKGVAEYQSQYWKAKSDLEAADKKFTRLAVKMAEQAISDQKL